MKTTTIIASAFLIALFTISSASALPFTEQWTGSDLIGELENERFFFNFWDSAGASNRTTSDLELVQDVAMGSLNPIQSAFVDITIYSIDKQKERPRFTINIWDDNQGPIVSEYLTLDLNSSDPYYTWHYDFTDTDLAALEATGFGAIAVKALKLGNQRLYNDFLLTDVSITANTNVAPVPEPATLLLLGTGLAGLAGLRHRKRRK